MSKWEPIVRAIKSEDRRRQDACFVSSPREIEDERIAQLCEQHPTDSHFVVKGRFFGYPECCIQSLIERIQQGTQPRLEYSENPKVRRFQQRYFVPCKECAALIEERWDG